MDILIRRIALLLVAIAVFLPCGILAEELDQNDKAHSWKGPSAQYVLIDFAAAWCKPCWKALPRLQKFADEHPSVGVIVVSVDESVQGRDKLVETLGLKMPVLWDGQHRIAEHYRPEGMPATFVLNPAGKVVYQHVGSGSREWDEMTAFVENALRD